MMRQRGQVVGDPGQRLLDHCDSVGLIKAEQDAACLLVQIARGSQAALATQPGPVGIIR